MTDQGQPLSRRDRRAMEQGAAGQSAGTETGEIPTIGPDGKPLSRRDRRRLERSESPMEIWTAEEEQLATGQMPAMTPEVIAEQEALAREKARIAAEEAAAASAELRGVAPSSVSNTRIDEIEGRAATAGQPAWMADIAADASTASAAPAPAMPAPVTPLQGAPMAEDDAASEIPEAFRHMFPPGSLQARAISERAAAAADSAPSAGEAPGDAPDPAEEIRRLTAAAMAGIEGNRGEADAAPGQQTPPQGMSSPYDTPAGIEQPEFDRYAGQMDQAPATSQEQPQVPAFEQPAPESAENRQAPGAFAGFGLAAGQAAPEVQQPSFGNSPPPALAPLESPFEQLAGLGQHAAPQQPELQQPELQQPEQHFDPAANAPQPASSPFNAPASPEYGTPAAGTPGAGIPGFDSTAAGTPGGGVPGFDATGVVTPGAGIPGFNTPGAGTPGAFGPQSGQFPVTTGSIEIQRRAVPELEPDGGARDFRWAHLLVIGAIAFALGVVVWHLAGVGQ
ncbi:MAG: hypothetical protein CVT64_04485 [Actinobacteria bacterium HGW-Actinobacteria-4]|nr:MAG: hypothetical protein CVT64_04485 [Actinobacteria bacterium HGW-Actinobacteria-4]